MSFRVKGHQKCVNVSNDILFFQPIHFIIYLLIFQLIVLLNNSFIFNSVRGGGGGGVLFPTTRGRSDVQVTIFSFLCEIFHWRVWN